MNRVRILLVDDEVVFTRNMTRLLQARDYIVTPANSGQEALDFLEEQDFDVVVLDLKMPGLDGMATLRQIKKAGYMTEVLILTGHGAIDTALETLKLGSYDYLAKPCEVDELVEKLEGAFKLNEEDRQAEMDGIIKRAVESPSSVLGAMASKKDRKPPRSSET